MQICARQGDIVRTHHVVRVLLSHAALECLRLSGTAAALSKCGIAMSTSQVAGTAVLTLCWVLRSRLVSAVVACRNDCRREMDGGGITYVAVWSVVSFVRDTPLVWAVAIAHFATLEELHARYRKLRAALEVALAVEREESKAQLDAVARMMQVEAPAPQASRNFAFLTVQVCAQRVSAFQAHINFMHDECEAITKQIKALRGALLFAAVFDCGHSCCCMRSPLVVRCLFSTRCRITVMIQRLLGTSSR